MADELERARKREAKLVAVFSAIDARDDAQIALGQALVELRDLGVAQADLAEMTGLSAREVGAAIRAAKDNTPVTDDTVNDADGGDTPAADQTSADTNGEQQH
ncbi:MAG TPA: hypothetical protein H9755_08885 [Candidatus Dietzia intestinigallinarum]|nr:hypothetical protein [Candidatus Dietzia intestinigallinarum]